MSCTPVTLASINTECGNNMGGIKEVLAQNHASVTGVTVTDGKITAFTLASNAPEAAKFNFRKQTGNMHSEYAIDDAGGSKPVNTTVALRFAKMETAKRTAFMAMANGELALIVQDNNGVYWYLGKDNPVTLSAGTGDTGTNFTDSNEYAPTLSDTSLEMPMEVAAAAVTTFLNASA